MVRRPLGRRPAGRVRWSSCPPTPVSTEVARGLLPDAVPHADAAANAGRAALLVAALAGRPEHLLAATRDYLHQEYREPAMPESLALVDRLRADGIPAVICGAGPDRAGLRRRPAAATLADRTAPTAGRTTCSTSSAAASWWPTDASRPASLWAAPSRREHPPLRPCRWRGSTLSSPVCAPRAHSTSRSRDHLSAPARPVSGAGSKRGKGSRDRLSNAPSAKKRGGGLSSMLLADLKSMAGGMGISGAGSMKKAQLVDAIKAAQSGRPGRQPGRARRDRRHGSSPRADAQRAGGRRRRRSRSQRPRAGSRPRRGRARRRREPAGARAAAGPGDEADPGRRPQDRAGERARRRQRTPQPGPAAGRAASRTSSRPDQQDQASRTRTRARTRRASAARTSRTRQKASRPQGQRQQDQDQQGQRGQDQRQQDQQQPAAAEPAAGPAAGPASDQRTRTTTARAAAAATGAAGGRDRERPANRPGSRNEPDTTILEDDVLVPAAGILDVLDNYAFVRTSGYLPGHRRRLPVAVDGAEVRPAPRRRHRRPGAPAPRGRAQGEVQPDGAHRQRQRRRPRGRARPRRVRQADPAAPRRAAPAGDRARPT